MNSDIIIAFKPSLRRAYFFAFIYAVFIAVARMELDLDFTNPVVLGAVGLLVLLLVFANIRRAFVTYSLTSDHVQVQSGILARSLVRVELVRITDASAKQSFFERLLGIANIYINTAGSPTNETAFNRILVSDARRFDAEWTALKKRKAAAAPAGMAAN